MQCLKLGEDEDRSQRSKRETNHRRADLQATDSDGIGLC